MRLTYLLQSVALHMMNTLLLIIVCIQVVSHIMRFLDLPDRKSAAQVCRSWYYASLDNLLLSDVVVTFQSWSEFHAALPQLCKRSRINLVLESIDSSISTREQVASVDREVLRRVRSLSLAGCDITEGLFTSMLGGCTGLEKLDISRCNALFMTGQLLSKPEDVKLLSEALARLRELKIASVRYISDESFSRLVPLCSGLEKLSLSGNQMVFHTKNYLWKGKETAVLTFSNIMNFFEATASRITALDFSRTAINDEALSSLASVPNLCLHELCLSCCQDVTDKGVASVCKSQHLLELLDLTDCQSVTDSAVDRVCLECDNLRVLRIGKCRRVTDLSACKLKSLGRLRQLDVSACYSLTSRGLCLGLCSTVSPLLHLTSLNVAYCSSLCDSFIVEMTRSLPGLTKLDISSCSVSDIGLRAICSRLTGLRSLRLAWCRDITDAGLLGVPDLDADSPQDHGDGTVGRCRCTRRHQSLNIFNPPKHGPVKVLTMPKSEHSLDEADFRPITNLRNLRLLDLTSCNRISDAGVSQVMAFTELRCLYLSLCTKLTDMSLAAIGAGLPSLEELHLALLTSVTDAGVAEISERLRRLMFLDVSSCDQLTDKSIAALFRNTKTLRQLDVSLCTGISREAVDKLERRLDRLVLVHRRHIDIGI